VLRPPKFEEACPILPQIFPNAQNLRRHQALFIALFVSNFRPGASQR
jgi:hypothetical protein